MSAADPRPTIFLSYARADQEQAARLAEALKAAGLAVWWDALIEGGAAFAKSIETALEQCDAVVVCWSRQSVSSDWVLDEAARGRDLRKLVPVSLDGTAPPLGFRQYQAIDLTRWRDDPAASEVAAILRGIAAISSPTAPSLTTRRGPVSRRRAVAIGAGTIAALAGGVAVWRFKAGSSGAPTSVAVLPFVNLSGSADQDYFSDGLSEELRATLARDPRLRVMAQASTRQFRAHQEGAVSIANQLGVEFLLDGSVRRAGNTVRVTADVIDGANGYSRWSQIFERELSSIFEVQRAISTTVAHVLVTRFAPGDGKVAAESMGGLGETRSVEAYDAYLRGRALYELSSDEASERAALAMFDAALEADPDFAAAHAARARSLVAIANQFGQASELATLYGAAVASAKRAIALAPDLAEAHSTLGFTLFQGQLDARAARIPFERSRELGAGEATVLARYAQYAARTGESAAASLAMAQALVLDRLNPLLYRAAGAIEYAARRWNESIAPARQALTMNPKLSRTHAAIGDALLMLGRPTDARLEYLAEPAADLRLTGLAIVERRLKHGPAAQAAREELVAKYGDSASYQQAQILADWGQRDDAIARLQTALALGDSGLIYARNDPLLDSLRSDRRFQDLLKRLGFD